MTNQPEHAIDRHLEHPPAPPAPDVVLEGRAADMARRLATPLTVVDLDDVLMRIEAKVVEAREAITDEAEGDLGRAIDDLVVEAFLAHRVVTTW